MPSKSEPYTLEENLALTNKEFSSNVGRLASLIRSYEGIGWAEARKKAGKLLSENSVDQYVDSVRKAVKEGKPTPAEDPTQNRPIHPPKPENQKTIYEKNYDRFMKLCPGLEQMLLNYKRGDEITGRSESTGYMDWIVELLFKMNGLFHFSISHYFKMNGDMVPDPDMEISIDVKHGVLEALHFQDQRHYREVYDDKIDRRMVDAQQKQSQNRFLEHWLKNLKRQGHLIVWDKKDSTGVEHESQIVDHYGKKAENSESDDDLKPQNNRSKRMQPTNESENSTKKKEAKIIQMEAAPELKKERVAAFLMIVDYLEFNMFGSPNALVDRAEEIVSKVGSASYLVDHFGQLIRDKQKLLKTSNFFRSIFMFKRMLDFATESNLELRLVSEKSEVAYSIQGGSSKSGNLINIAVHQIDSKVEDQAVMMLNIDPGNYLMGISLVSTGFTGFPKYDADQKKDFKEAVDVVMLEHLDKWLVFLLDNNYTVIEPNLKVVPENSIEQVAPASEITESSETEQHSAHYINEDIPDFEPGHVQLTEAHIKRGVTQAMIDKINQTQEGIVILPKKKMIKNTKSVDMDRESFAEKPGFRLSRTGKFYTETRSNRADRTSYGL